MYLAGESRRAGISASTKRSNSPELVERGRAVSRSPIGQQGTRDLSGDVNALGRPRRRKRGTSTGPTEEQGGGGEDSDVEEEKGPQAVDEAGEWEDVTQFAKEYRDSVSRESFLHRTSQASKSRSKVVWNDAWLIPRDNFRHLVQDKSEEEVAHDAPVAGTEERKVEHLVGYAPIVVRQWEPRKKPTAPKQSESKQPSIALYRHQRTLTAAEELRIEALKNMGEPALRAIWALRLALRRATSAAYFLRHRSGGAASSFLRPHTVWQRVSQAVSNNLASGSQPSPPELVIPFPDILAQESNSTRSIMLNTRSAFGLSLARLEKAAGCSGVVGVGDSLREQLGLARSEQEMNAIALYAETKRDDPTGFGKFHRSIGGKGWEARTTEVQKGKPITFPSSVGARISTPLIRAPTGQTVTAKSSNLSMADQFFLRGIDSALQRAALYSSSKVAVRNPRTRTSVGSSKLFEGREQSMPNAFAGFLWDQLAQFAAWQERWELGEALLFAGDLGFMPE